MPDTKNEFLSSLFGNVAAGPCGLRYWLLPGCGTEAADLNMLLSFDFDRPMPDSITAIFKGSLSKRTRVVRFQSGGVSYIAKIFRPYHIRNLIRDHITHKRYIFSELKNNVLAASRGISTPRLYAYFEQTFLGLVRQTGIVMEDLKDHTLLRDLLNCGKRTIFDTLPVLEKLFRKGIYHIDLNTKNILLRESDNHWTLIDWPYCSFHPQLNDLQLLFMAATMLRSAKIDPADPQWLTWNKALYAQCCLKVSFDKMLKAVQIMQSRKPSKSPRMSLDISQLGLDGVW